MISSDERRDVARRLRELANYCDENEMSLADDDWPGILSDYIWPENSGYHIYDEDCRRLADLIEPEPERTARLEYDDMHGCNVCTGCGERYGHGRYMAVTYDGLIVYKPMRFCPACDARLEGVGR